MSNRETKPEGSSLPRMTRRLFPELAFPDEFIMRLPQDYQSLLFTTVWLLDKKRYSYCQPAKPSHISSEPDRW